MPRLSDVSPAGRVPNPQVLLFHRLCWPLDRCSKSRSCFYWFLLHPKRSVCRRVRVCVVDQTRWITAVRHSQNARVCPNGFVEAPTFFRSDQYWFRRHRLQRGSREPCVSSAVAPSEFPNFRPAAADLFFPTDVLSRAVVSINGTWRPWWKLKVKTPLILAWNLEIRSHDVDELICPPKKNGGKIWILTTSLGQTYSMFRTFQSWMVWCVEVQSFMEAKVSTNETCWSDCISGGSQWDQVSIMIISIVYINTAWLIPAQYCIYTLYTYISYTYIYIYTCYTHDVLFAFKFPSHEGTVVMSKVLKMCGLSLPCLCISKSKWNLLGYL